MQSIFSLAARRWNPDVRVQNVIAATVS
jgi:hypothetical protein